MKTGKMKPVATIVAQFAAGVEVEAIQHNGKVFFPVMTTGEFDADLPEPAPTPTKKSAPKVEEEVEETEKELYTEDVLMDMDVKELTKILKGMGINPDDTDGKNTNKKLRTLILKNQDAAPEEEEEEEEETPKKKESKKSKKEESDDDEEDSEEDSDYTEDVTSILDDFDTGKKNKKKAVAAIVALKDDVDSEEIVGVLEEFEEDGDADIDETVEKIVAILNGEAKKAKKSSKKESKKSKKEELVDASDLKKGDRVSIFWDDDDNQDWFDGTVKSVKGTKVVIAYDDDTEEAIDEEIHTKIRRI